MATESKSELTGHLRGVTTTTLACLAGVLAALVSGLVTGTTPAAAADPRGLFILAAFLLVQFPVLRAFRIDVSGFGVKDHLYVAFMTFTLWFITFTILLTSGVELPTVLAVAGY
jgi:hypothetical protein